ncbi:hypothetical protein M885DRAFT_440622, partial [Pelagophyceae sp. CCMP2097]
MQRRGLSTSGEVSLRIVAPRRLLSPRRRRRVPSQVLKIKSTASLQTVRAAYRNRARETHPDKNPGDEERAAKRFLEATKRRPTAERRARRAVVSAFELLSDDDERRRYDSTG